MGALPTPLTKPFHSVVPIRKKLNALLAVNRVQARSCTCAGSPLESLSCAHRGHGLCCGGSSDHAEAGALTLRSTLHGVTAAADNAIGRQSLCWSDPQGEHAWPYMYSIWSCSKRLHQLAS